MHECPTCGNLVRKAKRKYCSQKCREAQTEKIESECNHCGKTFWRYKSQIDHQTQRGDTQAGKFCSRACYFSSRSKP